MDLSDIFGGITDAFKLGYNLFTNQRDFDYQKALQQQIFEREDTAVQRRMADLKAAGINPNLAAGSAAGAGSVVSRSNTNDLGSSLDTVMALNSIKQQKQQVENAKEENKILKFRENQAQMDQELNLASTMQMLGLPVDIKVNVKDGKFKFTTGLGDWDNKSDGEWIFNGSNSPLYELLSYDLKNAKNAADLLQKDVDWYTADKVSGMALGLLGLGNSASGWRKMITGGK